LTAAITITVTMFATPLSVAQTADGGWSSNVRASDEALVSLVTDGMKKSETLKGLVDRLAKSDVIVYVRNEVAAKGNGQGSLTFLSASGGFRYLVVHVPTTPSRTQRLAMLGHELQHAVAIANAPSVVDSQTLKAEFERIGRVEQLPNGRGISFDSPAAVEARRRVLSEVASDDTPKVASSSR